MHRIAAVYGETDPLCLPWIAPQEFMTSFTPRNAFGDTNKTLPYRDVCTDTISKGGERKRPK